MRLRRVLLFDRVALVFDRPPGHDERQIVFERMDWTHPNRRGYFEKNQPFIAQAQALLRGRFKDRFAYSRAVCFSSE